jgi:hypothetical protein
VYWQQRNYLSNPGRVKTICFSSKASKPILGPSDFLRRGGQSFLSSRVKQLVCEADLSLPTGAEVKSKWSCTSTLLCAFMVCAWKHLLYMDDGYGAADGDGKSWAGKEMDHA